VEKHLRTFGLSWNYYHGSLKKECLLEFLSLIWCVSQSFWIFNFDNTGTFLSLWVKECDYNSTSVVIVSVLLLDQVVRAFDVFVFKMDNLKLTWKKLCLKHDPFPTFLYVRYGSSLWVHKGCNLQLKQFVTKVFISNTNSSSCFSWVFLSTMWHGHVSNGTMQSFWRWGGIAGISCCFHSLRICVALPGFFVCVLVLWQNNRILTNFITNLSVPIVVDDMMDLFHCDWVLSWKLHFVFYHFVCGVFFTRLQTFIPNMTY